MTTTQTPITDRQMQALRFIAENMAVYSPTVREIAAFLGSKNPAAGQAHLDALEKKGLIARDHRKDRNITLTEAGRHAINAER